MPVAALHFYFDPVCPFSWTASRWVRQVQVVRQFSIEWRFLSLRLINRQLDYSQLPPDYEPLHDAGLRMLRVAALVRTEVGPRALDSLQSSFGMLTFERSPWESRQERLATLTSAGHILAALRRAGLPASLGAAADDDSWDPLILAEGDSVRKLTGRDVGTPVLHVNPPYGAAFFGPVLSRYPGTDSEAVDLWDHVLGLARYGGFAELKRSLREKSRLPVHAPRKSSIGIEEEWREGVPTTDFFHGRD